MSILTDNPFILEYRTAGRGLYSLEQQLEPRLPEKFSGLCHLFIQHTSAALIITENADPDVHLDLETWFSSRVPDGAPQFRHRAEGEDDMSAHIRTVLSGETLTIPVLNGRLALGTWQGIYLWEHRTGAHCRCVVVTLIKAVGAEQLK